LFASRIEYQYLNDTYLCLGFVPRKEKVYSNLFFGLSIDLCQNEYELLSWQLMQHLFDIVLNI